MVIGKIKNQDFKTTISECDIKNYIMKKKNVIAQEF